MSAVQGNLEQMSDAGENSNWWAGGKYSAGQVNEDVLHHPPVNL